MKQNGAPATVTLGGAQAGTPGAVRVGLGAGALAVEDPPELLAVPEGSADETGGALETVTDVADDESRCGGELLVHPAAVPSAASTASAPTAGSGRRRMRPLSQAGRRSGRRPRALRGDARDRVGYLAAMTDPGSYPPAPSGPAAGGGARSGPGTPADVPAGRPAQRNRSFSTGQFLAGILFVLTVIFIVENTDNVKIRIIAGPKVNAPIFVALLIAAIAGALISELLRLRRKHHKRR